MQVLESVLDELPVASKDLIKHGQSQDVKAQLFANTKRYNKPKFTPPPPPQENLEL